MPEWCVIYTQFVGKLIDYVKPNLLFLGIMFTVVTNTRPLGSLKVSRVTVSSQKNIPKILAL